MIAWSDMTHEQRAYLLARRDDAAVQEVIKRAIKLDGAFSHERKRALRDNVKVAIAKFDGVVVRLPPGYARGTNELQRQRSHALPMQYFRQGGGC